MRAPSDFRQPVMAGRASPRFRGLRAALGCSVVAVLAAIWLAVPTAAQQPRPRPRPVAPAQPSARPASRTLPAALLIQVDMAARVVVDGEPQTPMLAADEVRRVPVMPGQHIVQAVSVDDARLRVQQAVEVKSAGQVIVTLNLRGLLAAGRAAEERAAKRGADNATSISPSTLPTGIDALPWVRIPAGTFDMGCVLDDLDCRPAERPSHRVVLTKAFELMANEVTVRDFRAFAVQQPYQTTAELVGYSRIPNGGLMETRAGVNWKLPGFAQDDAHPVVHMSRDDAKAFCRAVGGRLPTEAEWEYAARGGVAGALYSWGGPLAAPAANIADEALKAAMVSWDFFGWRFLPGYNDGFVYTAPVGRYRANSFGLYDMAGNVWEWVADLYEENDYQSLSRTDPTGPASGETWILRGGSWYNDVKFVRTSSRSLVRASSSFLANSQMGIRCARDVTR